MKERRCYQFSVSPHCYGTCYDTSVHSSLDPRPLARNLQGSILFPRVRPRPIDSQYFFLKWTLRSSYAVHSVKKTKQVIISRGHTFGDTCELRSPGLDINECCPRPPADLWAKISETAVAVREPERGDTRSRCTSRRLNSAKNVYKYFVPRWPKIAGFASCYCLSCLSKWTFSAGPGIFMLTHSSEGT